METHSNARDTTSQPEGGERPLVPYPLTRGTLALWLRRGEQLGRAVRWIAAIAAAGARRAATRRRHVASNRPMHPPSATG